MIICTVCGFPMTKIGCVHTILGYTADEWREKIQRERNKLPSEQAAQTAQKREQIMFRREKK